MDLMLPILTRDYFLLIQPDICPNLHEIVVQAANLFLIATCMEEKYSKLF
jgi:hypothetical protein